MFKAGDRVRKKNGKVFSNREHILTVSRVDGGRVWLEETESWIQDFDVEIDIPSPSPVRTVTRREIVPGTYGCVEVDVYSYGMNVVADFSGGRCTAEELREAAHILNQLAEALEDKP